MEDEWDDEESEGGTRVSADHGDAVRQALEQQAQHRAACLIVIAGPTLGQMIELQQAVVLGRGAEADVALHDKEVSRRHAQLAPGTEGVTLTDLGSTNGTFVNGEPIESRLLQDGDKILLGKSSILKFSYQDHLEAKFQQRMYDSIVRDAHTRAYNKRYLLEQLRHEISFAKRHGAPLAILMFDIDHFKQVNDVHGHLAGDAVLLKVVQGIASHLRREDTVARYGGEEFVILCRGTTVKDGVRLANRVRELVAKTQVEHEGQTLSVTISIGVAALPDPGIQDENALIAAADGALYVAKSEGRNRVVAHDARARESHRP